MTGAELKMVRLAMGMTQKALAKRLGRDRRTVINYEAGKVEIPALVDEVVMEMYIGQVTSTK